MNMLLLLACVRTDDGSSDDTAADTASTGDTSAPDPRFDALRAAVLADIEANYASGASVAVLDHGRVIYAEGFGSADPEADVPVTPTTLFQIGSNSKMYTAAAMLRLVDAGTVALDDTVADYVPEMVLKDGVAGPSDPGAITLHHLLTHQGGFTDAVDWAGSSADAELDTYWSQTYGRSYGLQSTPGAFWNYSNPNFGVAGLIEERVDARGRAWPDIISEDILAPLGMDRTFTRKADVEEDGDYALSYGYKSTLNGLVGPTRVPMEKVTDPASVRPAGMIWSTPSQLMMYADFLMHGNTDVLSDASRAALTGEQVNTLYAEGQQWYGYGIFIDRSFSMPDGIHERPLWEHGGNTLSMTCSWYVLPEQDWGIAILSNGYGDNFGASVAAGLETLADVGPAVAVDPPDIDTARLADFEGSYQAQSNVGAVVITRDGDGLRATFPDLDAVGYPYDPVLQPYSTTIWLVTFDGVQYDLTFVGEEGQPATWIRNRAFAAVRVPPTE
jgi:CubicO group peptidase (beta-lactamase class C family)